MIHTMNDVYIALKRIEVEIQLCNSPKALELVDELKSKVYIARRDKTKCPYCKVGKTPYNEAGLLCDNCREDFGHATIGEL